MQHLALQVGEVDQVVVDDPEGARRRPPPGRAAGASRGRRRRSPSTLDVQQLFLAFLADFRQHDVAGVAVDLLVGEFHARLHTAPRRGRWSDSARRRTAGSPRSSCRPWPAGRRLPGRRRERRRTRCRRGALPRRRLPGRGLKGGFVADPVSTSSIKELGVQVSPAGIPRRCLGFCEARGWPPLRSPGCPRARRRSSCSAGFLALLQHLGRRRSGCRQCPPTDTTMSTSPPVSCPDLLGGGIRHVARGIRPGC